MTSDPGPDAEGSPPLPYGQQPNSPAGYEPTVSYPPPTYGRPLPPAAGYGQPGLGQPGPGQPGLGQPGLGQPPAGPVPYGHPLYGLPAAAPGMRAAAADRERTMDVLKAAYTEGRLTKEEFDFRATRTMNARTYADLAALVADLPAGPGGAAVVAYHPGYYPAAPVPPTNGMAIGALVCGILEIFTLGAASVPAVILGHIARGQIRRTGERGDGLAIAGLVLGYLGVGLWLLIFIALVAGGG